MLREKVGKKVLVKCVCCDNPGAAPVSTVWLGGTPGLPQHTAPAEVREESDSELSSDSSDVSITNIVPAPPPPPFVDDEAEEAESEESEEEAEEVESRSGGEEGGSGSESDGSNVGTGDVGDSAAVETEVQGAGPSESSEWSEEGSESEVESGEE